MTPIAQKTLDDLQWNQVLAALGQRAKTDLGKARCLARPFFDHQEEIERELKRTEEQRRLAIEERLSLPSWGIRDVRAQLERAEKGGALDSSQLLACAAVIQGMLRLRDFVESRASKMPLSWAIAEPIPELGKLAGRIEKSFEPSGELSDRASPELAVLREKVRGIHRGIKGKLDAMLHDEGFTRLLRENYFTIRNERYVVPVVVAFRSQVPGIVHNASQSGQTLFVEPEALISMGNELTIAQSMVLEEERRILLELSGLLGQQAPVIAEALERCAELDAVEAAARLALDLDANPATIVPAAAPFKLLAMRHPLLALQQKKKVIPNDVAFAAQEQVLVVSGPNAGGKTVTLTGVGLCGLLLRAGLFIPAEQGSSLPLFTSVESAVGDDQDLSKDLSTFSAHLVRLRDILETAGEGTLVLIDEIAADTDPREGAAIALAVLEELAEQGARTIVTTHLDELKAIAVTDPRYVNARVGFDPEKLAPTYHLQYGFSGSSSAIEIARRMGLDPELCHRAEENLKTHAGPLGKALAALEQQRIATELMRRELEEEHRALEEERSRLSADRERVRERERAIEKEARQELVAEVERVRVEVAKTLAELQAKPTIRAAVEAQAKLAQAAESEQAKLAREQAAASVKKEEKLPESTPLEAGMRVKVPGLGEAMVLEIHGQEALIAAGALKQRRKVAELVPLKGAPKAAGFPSGAKKKEEKLKRAQQAGAGEIDYGNYQVDVRGMRAEDAIKAVETFLDRCFGEGTPGALIVHGLGTGALRATIRDYVRDSPYVRTYRSGQPHEGGEGVTVVELRS